MSYHGLKVRWDDLVWLLTQSVVPIWPFPTPGLLWVCCFFQFLKPFGQAATTVPSPPAPTHPPLNLCSSQTHLVPTSPGCTFLAWGRLWKPSALMLPVFPQTLRRQPSFSTVCESWPLFKLSSLNWFVSGEMTMAPTWCGFFNFHLECPPLGWACGEQGRPAGVTAHTGSAWLGKRDSCPWWPPNQAILSRLQSKACMFYPSDSTCWSVGDRCFTGTQQLPIITMIIICLFITHQVVKQGLGSGSRLSGF